MNRLTEEEIQKYIKEANSDTGVKAITREMLEKIDLDTVRDFVRDGDRLKTPEGEQVYKLERFTPRSGSYAFKPSFAGSQILIGKELGTRELYFSDGRWFVNGW